MSRIYDEALLDAKKIRETAEQAARDKIMESITPQIRQMINARILFEQDGLEDDLEGDASEELGIDLMEPGQTDDGLDFDSIVDSIPDVDVDDSTTSQMMDTAADVADSAIAVYASGDVNIELETEEDEADDETLMTDRAIAEAFAKLVKHDFIADKKINARITRLEEKVSKLRGVLSVVREGKLRKNQQRRLELSFVSLVKEGVSLQNDLRRSGRGSQRLQKRLNSTIKEMREMSSKYKKNIFDFLFEAEDAEMKKEGMYEQDEVETDEVEVDVEEEEVEVGAEDVDVDAASTALEDLGVALGLDLEITEEGEEGEEEGDEELELDDEEELDLEEGEMYEISEAALRRELKRMRRRRQLREQEEGVDDSVLDNFGGGDSDGDVVVDVDEDDLINALADELGDAPTPDVGGALGGPAAGGDAMPESRRRRARRIAERRRRSRRSPSRNQSAIREAAEYKRAAQSLKKQLVEMNLFNAKLLYANKLLQNKNLTVKQQRAIVEALDNAKTLREAKLLYKSLSGSLARRGRSGKTLSESVRRTLGSSSRSTRSAQPSSNGVETDRWAVLAGIGK